MRTRTRTLKPAETGSQGALDTLLFVDTNILLDLYRIGDGEVTRQFLEQLERCRDDLVVNSQLEMEYKKNRQKVMLAGLADFDVADDEQPAPPALLGDPVALQMIEKKKAEISRQKAKIDAKVERLLADPGRHDSIYRALQRLFRHPSAYNLTAGHEAHRAITDRARERFVLGYPPRKRSDTSIGDAIHWEWILACAIESGKHVVMVTRDSDFGAVHDGRWYLNDWLTGEFSERVGKKRKIAVTGQLCEGLKMLEATVTEDMEAEEEHLIGQG